MLAKSGGPLVSLYTVNFIAFTRGAERRPRHATSWEDTERERRLRAIHITMKS